jgi:hypothetical protein
MNKDHKETTAMVRDDRGRFIKGYSGNPIGKPRGAVSKLGRLKEDFFGVYNKMGGKNGLFAWAKEHPTEFYTMLYKLLPRTANTDAQVMELSYEERLQLMIAGSIDQKPNRELVEVKDEYK